MSTQNESIGNIKRKPPIPYKNGAFRWKQQSFDLGSKSAKVTYRKYVKELESPKDSSRDKHQKSMFPESHYASISYQSTSMNQNDNLIVHKDFNQAYKILKAQI